MLGQTHTKLYYQFKKAFGVYLHVQDRFHPSRFSMRYCKDIANLLFWVLWNSRLRKPKVILSICRKFWYLFLGKKLTSFPTFFGGYCKDMPISYFGYFGHVWLRTSKMMVSTCRQLRCLSACLKWTSLFAFFLRYYILKNPEIWLANSFWNISREAEFC